MKLKVRAAVAADKPRFRELMAVFTETPLTAKQVANRFGMLIGDREQALFVATADGLVAGLLAFRIRHNLESVSHYGEVAAIVVDPAWRNRGVGAALLAHAEKFAKKRKCVGLWLVSGFGREEEAHKFYAGQGFSRTGLRFVKPL